MKVTFYKTLFILFLSTLSTMLLPSEATSKKMMDRSLGGMGMFGGGNKVKGAASSAMEAMIVAGIMAKLLSSSNSGSSMRLGGMNRIFVPMPVIHMSGGPLMGGYGMMTGGYGMGGGQYGMNGGGGGYGMNGGGNGMNGGGYGMGMGMGGYGMSMGMRTIWAM
ncbi:hypothetical protein JTE90_005279 [Oedothorax gibbosus]|uniref:Glycine-rich protein n=1 Tax=Oedothorax gibbosus TaxID=931172 RepID=A0AAV6U1M5_9ARAC|nr:hypothetical protein JTE90_005279 [Oedothorax gibbosus]